MPRVRISAKLRRLVIARARECCEYCLLHQDYSSFTHPVDHIIAVKHRGLTALINLALACLECNLNKGTDFATIDWETGEVTLLFNPRTQRWHDHFAFAGAEIIGLTPTGRATIDLLQLNSLHRLSERQDLMALGVYPPEWLESETIDK
jgi:hypothetical protein